MLNPAMDWPCVWLGFTSWGFSQKKSWVKKQSLQEQAVHHHNSLAKVGIDPWYPWGWHKHSWFGIVFFPRHILLKSNSGISSPSSCVSCMSIDEPLESVLKNNRRLKGHVVGKCCWSPLQFSVTCWLTTGCKISLFCSSFWCDLEDGERKVLPFLFCLAWFRRIWWPRKASDTRDNVIHIVQTIFHNGTCQHQTRNSLDQNKGLGLWSTNSNLHQSSHNLCMFQNKVRRNMLITHNTMHFKQYTVFFWSHWVEDLRYTSSPLW